MMIVHSVEKYITQQLTRKDLTLSIPLALSQSRAGHLGGSPGISFCFWLRSHPALPWAWWETAQAAEKNRNDWRESLSLASIYHRFTWLVNFTGLGRCWSDARDTWIWLMPATEGVVVPPEGWSPTWNGNFGSSYWTLFFQLTTHPLNRLQTFKTCPAVKLTLSWPEAAAAAANKADEETAMEDPLSAVLPTLALAFRSLTAIFTPLIPPETLRIIPFLKTQKRTGLPCENPNSPSLLIHT